MKVTKFLKVGVLGLMSLAIFSACGAKEDPAAREAVRTAMANSSKIKSAEYAVTVEGKITAKEGSEAEFKELDGSLSFEGAYDRRNKDVLDFYLEVGVNGKADGGDEQKLAAAVSVTNDKLYFALDELKLAAIPPLYLSAVEQLKDKWFYIEVPAEVVGQLNALSGDEASMTPEQKEAKALYEKTYFFKNVKDKGEDKVDDVAVQKYTIELDQEALQKYLQESAKIGGLALTEENLSEMTKVWSLAEFKGTVWISKDDQTIRKMDGRLTIKAGEDTENLAFDVQANYSVKNVNKDVTHEQPQNPELFDLGKILGMPAGLVEEAPVEEEKGG